MFVLKRRYEGHPLVGIVEKIDPMNERPIKRITVFNFGANLRLVSENGCDHEEEKQIENFLKNEVGVIL